MHAIENNLLFWSLDYLTFDNIIERDRFLFISDETGIERNRLFTHIVLSPIASKSEC